METKGYIQRTVLNSMKAKKKKRGVTRERVPTGVEHAIDFVEYIARLDGNPVPDRDGLVVSTRKAFYALEEKGLIVKADESLDDYEPDDHRKTEWVITGKGDDERRRMSNAYGYELRELMKRYGRNDPASSVSWPPEHPQPVPDGFHEK